MRVLHIINGLASGGAETMLAKLLAGMDREAFEPAVVSLTDRGSLAEHLANLQVPVHALGFGSALPTPSAVWRLVRIVRRIRPHLIQGWMYHANLAAELASICVSEPAPVLWNIRHSIYRLADEKCTTAAIIRLGARLSFRPAHILYNAHVSAVQHEALGYRFEKRVVIPNGFDTQRFIPSEQARVRIRTELGLSSSTVLIGLIARYHPMKDHATFLRAAGSLVDTHPDVHFLLVGRDVDWDNAALVRLIQDTGVGTRIHLLGERTDIHQVTAALDVSAISSYSEGFPNVIGEAMACAVPCTVTDVGDSASIVGETGRVVPPRDHQALAEAWRALLRVGPAGRARLGRAARRRIEEHFSLPAVIARYEQLYRDSFKSGPVRSSRRQLHGSASTYRKS